MNKNRPVLAIWWPDEASQAKAEEEGRTLKVRFEVHALAGDRLHGGEESLASLPKDLNTLVLLHPSEVGLFAVTPPRLSGKKLQEALPFLVEPFLLNDPEDNQVSLHDVLAAQATGKQVAAVVTRARVRQVLQACRQYGLAPLALSAEALRGKPQAQAAGWVSGDHLLVSSADDAPNIIDLTQPAVAKALISRCVSSTAGRILLSAADYEKLASKLSYGQADAGWVEAFISSSIEISAAECKGPMGQLLRHSLAKPEDLRKSGLKRSTGTNGPRVIVPPLLLLLGIGVLGLNLLALRHHRAVDAIDQEIQTAYARAVPNTPMIADPLLLIERERKGLSSGLQGTNTNGLSNLLHDVGIALDDAPFNSITGVSFKPGVLTLTFTANVTLAMQESALQKLKARRLDGKWISNKGSNGPELQVKPGAGRA